MSGGPQQNAKKRIDNCGEPYAYFIVIVITFSKRNLLFLHNMEKPGIKVRAVSYTHLTLPTTPYV